MAKKFSNLVAAMSPQAQARIAAGKQQLIQEMPLHELRRARGLSQQALADMLHVQQPSIAKLERRTDMYISSLRSHIEAMGGELEIVAKFPDGTVRIASGYLEGSNVNVVDAMVEMISLTRNYELNIKLMQTSERNSEASATLLRVQ